VTASRSIYKAADFGVIGSFRNHTLSSSDTSYCLPSEFIHSYHDNLIITCYTIASNKPTNNESSTLPRTIQEARKNEGKASCSTSSSGATTVPSSQSTEIGSPEATPQSITIFGTTIQNADQYKQTTKAWDEDKRDFLCRLAFGFELVNGEDITTPAALELAPASTKPKEQLAS